MFLKERTEALIAAADKPLSQPVGSIAYHNALADYEAAAKNDAPAIAAMLIEAMGVLQKLASDVEQGVYDKDSLKSALAILERWEAGNG
jgi:hypothetical protein